MLSITILTSAITRDNLDPDRILADASWDIQRERYITMLREAVHAIYPDAKVHTAEGDGIDSVHITSDNPDTIAGLIESDNAVEPLYHIWASTYGAWCDSIPATACAGHAGGLVPDEWGCPHCGERRLDWLMCDGDDVLCATCNRTYSLNFGLDVEAEV